MPKTSGPLRILSDGTRSGTSVLTADGTVVEGITEIKVWIDASGMHEADLTIFAPIIDVKTIPGTTTLHCAICDEDHDHDCKPTTIGGV